MQHITEILADAVSRLEYSMIDKATLETTKLFVLDWYSAMFAGMKVNSKFNSAVEALIFGNSAENGKASPFMSRKKLREEEAAFLNAVYAHGADMDDGNRLAMGHISAHVISAVMAVAEAEGDKSGRDVIVAVNAGYEVFNRVAAAAQPMLVRRGFHSTGTAGAIACAAAVGKLIGLDKNGIYNAMSIAAVQSGGLIVIAESGQACKPLNPANAARLGIFSARLAQKGISAPVFPLESEKGWFHAMGGEANDAAALRGLGEIFTINESYLKPYPSCRHTHPPIQAAIKLREALKRTYGEDIPFERISSVRVRIYENAIRIAGQIKLPKNDEDTKFSIHYALAKALERGGFGLEELTLDAADPITALLAEKIILLPDDSLECAEKGLRGARTEIIMDDGRSFSETVLIPKGDPADPFTVEDEMEKLKKCSEGIIPRSMAEALAESVLGLENKASVSVNGALA